MRKGLWKDIWSSTCKDAENIPKYSHISDAMGLKKMVSSTEEATFPKKLFLKLH